MGGTTAGEAPIHLAPQRRNSDDESDMRGSGDTAEPLLGESAQAKDVHVREQPVWRRLTSKKMWSKPRRRKPSTNGQAFDVENVFWGRRRGSARCCKLLAGIFIALGVFQLITLLLNLVILMIPDRLHDILGSWGKPGHIGAGLAHWPTDFSRDILPIPCHSHNDYWRRVPLFSALEAGCLGVEADVWLFSEELYVGHSIASLTPNRTLNSLYVNPLLDILSKQNPDPLVIPDSDHHQNGVYDTNPEKSLILLIDFKTTGAPLFPYVSKALEPLRSKGYLSHINESGNYVSRPITVVGTGNTPFDLVLSQETNSFRDIFFDAPLDEMLVEAAADEDLYKQPPTDNEYTMPYNSTNSLYASVSFMETIGHLPNGDFSKEQLQKVRGYIKGAHLRGLEARFWELPFWPISLRNHVWSVLVEEGMDMLNVDDLKGAAEWDWSKRRSWT